MKNIHEAIHLLTIAITPVIFYFLFRSYVINNLALTNIQLGGANKYGIYENLRMNFHRLQDVHFTWDTFDFIWIIGANELIKMGRRNNWCCKVTFIFLPLLVLVFFSKFFTDPPRAFAFLMPLFIIVLAHGFSIMGKSSRTRLLLVFITTIFIVNIGRPNFGLEPGLINSNTGLKYVISLITILYYFFTEHLFEVRNVDSSTSISIRKL